MKTPSRKELKAAIDQHGIGRVMMTRKSELSPKMRKFAENVAMGETGADAYRKAYNTTAKPKTIGDNASRLKADSRIKAEIEAYQLAIESQKYQSAANIRALVVQSLVQVLIDSESSPAHRISASKVLGSISEIGMFTERKEITHIQASDDIRQTIMQQLKTIASDSTDVDVDANALLRDLIGDENGANASESGDYCDSDNDEGTVPVPPEIDFGTPASTLHTIPLKASQNLLDQDAGSPIPLQTTPFDMEKEHSGGDIFLEKRK